MITYRILLPFEIPKYAIYLKQRNLDSLQMYFGYNITPEHIDDLVEKMVGEPQKNHIVVAEDFDNEIVGTVHIAEMAEHQVEFGVMVAEAYRKQGIASGLMDYAMTWAQNRGYHDLYMHCLSYNAPIKHLVRKHGLSVSTEGTESDAEVTMSPSNIFTIGHEIVLRQRNAANYIVKHQIQSFRKALAV